MGLAFCGVGYDWFHFFVIVAAMAMLLEAPAETPLSVFYRCSCSVAAPLSRLYWCRHCVALRCPRCTQQEV